MYSSVCIKLPFTTATYKLGFARIFFEISLHTAVYASKIEVRITPYKRRLDQFSMVKNDYNRNLVATFNNETGVMEIVHNGAPVTEEDWQTVLNYPTYRLYIRVSIVLHLYDTMQSAASNKFSSIC